MRRRHRDDQRGAALVEAAMVLPLIVVILIGTVEFGLSLADLIAVRQGTRDATRNAVVDNYGSDTVCTITGTVGSGSSPSMRCRETVTWPGSGSSTTPSIITPRSPARVPDGMVTMRESTMSWGAMVNGMGIRSSAVTV